MKPAINYTRAALRFGFCSYAAAWLSFCAFGQGVHLVPASTVPRIQLTGENFQIFSNGKYFTDSTPGRTMSRYGVLGADLGFPVVYPDKILFLFGDTLAVYSTGSAFGTKYFLAAGSGADDSIGYIPNVDLSQCHYIGDVDQQLAAGGNASVPFGGCPAIRFYQNPHRGPTDHIFEATTISGLQAGEGLGPFQTPSGAVDYNGRLYMFYIVKYQDAKPHFALESIVARSDQESSAWSDTNPPTFTRLYTVSSHPAIADPNNLPPEAGDNGKFMFNPPVVMDAQTLSSVSWKQGLPPALQSAAKVAFVFGSSWAYNQSNLYLAAFSLADIEAGTSKWFYYAGQNRDTNTWSNDEKAAVPLLPDAPGIGNHSVLWSSALQRFILMSGNIVARFSPTPWGSWGGAVPVFPPNSSWASKLIHHPGADPITRSVIPVYNPKTGAVADLNSNATGVPYGPNLIDQFTQNPDGSVTAYYTMSTWNPYEVFLASSTFKAGPVPGPIESAASLDSSFVAPDSIAVILSKELANGTYQAAGAHPTTSLGGASVLVQDSVGVTGQALLYYVSPERITFVVPSGLAAGPATVTVLNGSTLVYSTTTRIAPLAPALFSADGSGTGPAAAIFLGVGADGKRTVGYTYTCGAAQGSCVATALDLSAAPNGAYLEFYGTGLRDNPGIRTVGVSIGGIPCAVTYAGSQNQYPGMDQVNVLVSPKLMGKGEVDVNLIVNGSPANTLRVAFK